ENDSGNGKASFVRSEQRIISEPEVEWGV
ncbi:uncharacterized protein METZ01_LOCUS356183, partial [marine metagenome]